MKKIILTGCLAVTVLFASNVNAQTYASVEKPTDATPFSIETSLLQNLGNGSGFTFSSPALRARYFFDNNIAARVQLGLGDGMGSAMTYSERFYENADGTGKEGTLEINRMAWTAQIGAEYHFLGTQKLDPYAALGINFGGGSSKAVGTMYDGTAFNENVSYEGEGGYSMIGAALGLGMDFYFVENIYIGAELGIAFNSYNYADVEQSTSIKMGNTTVTNTSVTGGNKESYLGTQASVRIGWRF